MWHVYLIRCNDNSLYTGITTNLKRRHREHVMGRIGSKYVRSKGIDTMHTVACYSSRSEAQSEESRIKKLTHEKKEALIQDQGVVLESEN